MTPGARRVLVVTVFLAILAGGCDGRIAFLSHELPELVLAEDDRILVLAPHPDDEVLGTGGVVQRAVAAGLPVRIVFLTYGDSNQWSFLFYRRRPTLSPRQALAMGELRREEAMSAAGRLGVGPESLDFLGYPDHGTLRIFATAWGDRPPVRGPLSRARAVAYETARRPGTPHKGEEVVADLAAVITGFRPSRVFVSHPADHHPDHAALYLFTRVALWELSLSDEVALHPYLVHYPKWSLATGARPDDPLPPPRDLRRRVGWRGFPLTDEEVRGKQAALEAHTTQYRYSARRLLRFVRANELFGDFPTISLGAAEVDLVDDEEGPEDTLEAPEVIAEEYLEELVDLEHLELRDDGESIRLTVRLDRLLEPGQSVSVFLFGHRDDRPFAEMPKIEVRIGSTDTRVLERGRRLPRSPVPVTRRGLQIDVAVPHQLLGHPQRLLLGGRSAYGSVPMDRLPWYVVALSPVGAGWDPPL